MTCVRNWPGALAYPPFERQELDRSPPSLGAATRYRDKRQAEAVRVGHRRSPYSVRSRNAWADWYATNGLD